MSNRRIVFDYTAPAPVFFVKNRRNKRGASLTPPYFYRMVETRDTFAFDLQKRRPLYIMAHCASNPQNPACRRPRTNRAYGVFVALFVWLSVFAPALHQHHQARFARQTAPVSAPNSAAPRLSASVQNHVAAVQSGCDFTADDLCVLCDYLTTTHFAPPPDVSACAFVRTNGLRGPPAPFVSPLFTSRAFVYVRLRGPPASA